MEMAIEYLQDHPEVFNELVLGLLCKEIGVPLPTLPDLEEELVREAARPSVSGGRSRTHHGGT